METKAALKALGALSQDSRLAIFRLLVPITGGMAAGQIADRLGIAPATLSFHLKELEGAGLLTAQRDGRHILYGVDHASVRRLLGFLLHDCCQGRPEICAPLGVACAIPAEAGTAPPPGRRC